MNEYSIGTGWNKDEKSETVPVERLYLVGCIGVWSNALERFPLPMLAVDGKTKITEYPTATRVEGLLPSENNSKHLINGDWTAQVDITTCQPCGEGEVYLGNANTPSETWGFIFEEPIPFNPDLELGFVYERGEQEVLWEREYEEGPAYLVYAETSVLEGLRKVHNFR